MANSRNSRRAFSSPRPAPMPSPAMLGFFAIFRLSALSYDLLGLFLAGVRRHNRINDLATSCFNGSTGTLGHTQTIYGQRTGYVTRQHDFGAFYAGVDDVGSQQAFQSYYVTLYQGQFAGANFSSYSTHTGTETELRQTTLQRHLTAFKARTNSTA